MNEKGYKNHKCSDLILDDVEIIYSNFYGEDEEKHQWWFHIYREAKEKDVLDGEADEIGDLLYSSAIVISYCPFCGKKLIDEFISNEKKI